MGLIERAIIRMTERVSGYDARDGKLSGYDQRGLTLGQASSIHDPHRTSQVLLTIAERTRHRLIAGGSGGGKSVSVLSESSQNISQRVGATMIDTHNTVDKLLRMIARDVVSKRLEERFLDDIWLLSPSCRYWSVRINPLYCKDPEHAPETVSRMLKLVKVLWGDALGAQTYQFSQSLFMLLAERRIPISEILSLLSDSVRIRSQAMKLVNRRAREYFLLQYLTWSPRRQAQVAEALINKIAVLLSDPRIEAALSSPQNDIDFRQAMDQGKTVLVHICRGEFFDSVSWLAAMILISFQQAAFSRADTPEHQRRPHILTIEEFPSFASTATVEPLLNEGRKFGIGLNLITQTFSALDKSLLSSIRANCLTQILFRLSPEDAQIAVAGLNGELRNAVYQKLVSMPVGNAVLLQGGKQPRLLRVDNVAVPETMSSEESDIIERIRRNIGQPLCVDNDERRTQTMLMRDQEDTREAAPYQTRQTEDKVTHGNGTSAKVFIEGDES